MRKTTTIIVGLFTGYLVLSVSVNGLTVANTPRKFDMFSHLSCRDELARVDNYSAELARVKDALAVIIMYAGRDDTMHGEVAAHLFSIRHRLVKIKSFDATRIVLIDGGFRERQEIELYIINSSARASAHYLTAPTLRFEEGRLKQSVFTRDVYRCSKQKESVAPSNKRLTRARRR
jgi:hypothetical protein